MGGEHAERFQRSVEGVVEVAGRLGAALRTIRDPSAPAVGTWTIGEAAAHVAFVFLGDGALLQHGDAIRDRIPVHGPITPGAVAQMNATMVAAAPDRTLKALAGEIEEGARQVAAAASRLRGDEILPWLGGLELPASAISCHLLSEAFVHGYDIAHGAGRRWPIAREHALLFLEGFMLPVMRMVPPDAFVDHEEVAGVSATYEVRLRGGRTHWFIFDKGGMRLPEISPERIDCYLWADPVAFSLVGYRRVPWWKPALRGKIVSWGRRPMLGARLARLIKTP